MCWWLMAEDVWWLHQSAIPLPGSCQLGLECVGVEWVTSIVSQAGNSWSPSPGNIQTKPGCHNQLSRRHTGHSPVTRLSHTVFSLIIISFTPRGQHWTLQIHFKREELTSRSCEDWRGGREGGREGGMVDNDCLHGQLRNDLIWHSRRLSARAHRTTVPPYQVSII